MEGLQFKVGGLIDHRYRVVKLLGQGTFARVFLVEDKRTFDQNYAVKVFNSLSRKPLVWEGIRNTLRFAHHIQSPYLLKVHDFGLVFPENLPYLVSEFVDGKPLSMATQRPRPKIFRHVSQQLLLGLNELHRVGLVHLDIKPSNIMLRGFGTRKPQAKIIDIGNYLIKPHLDFRSFPTTFFYLDPEVIRGKKPNESTDLFALGLTLYSWLTGRKPFRCASGEEHIGRVRLGKDVVSEINFESCGIFAGFLERLIRGDFISAPEALQALCLQPFVKKDFLNQVPSKPKKLNHRGGGFRADIEKVFLNKIRTQLLSNRLKKNFLILSGPACYEKTSSVYDVFLKFSGEMDVVLQRFRGSSQSAFFPFLAQVAQNFSGLGVLQSLSRTDVIQSLVSPDFRQSFFEMIFSSIGNTLRKCGPTIFLFENVSVWDFTFFEFIKSLEAFLAKTAFPLLVVLDFNHPKPFRRNQFKFQHPYLEILVREGNFGVFHFSTRKPLRKTPKTQIVSKKRHQTFINFLSVFPNPISLSVFEKLLHTDPHIREALFDLIHDGTLIRDDVWFYLNHRNHIDSEKKFLRMEVVEGLVVQDDAFIFPLVTFFPESKSTSALLAILERDLLTDQFQPLLKLIEISLKTEKGNPERHGRLCFFKGRILNYTGQISAAIKALREALVSEKNMEFRFFISVDLVNALAKQGQHDQILDFIHSGLLEGLSTQHTLFLKCLGELSARIKMGTTGFPIYGWNQITEPLDNRGLRARLNLRYAQSLIWSRHYQHARDVLTEVVADFLSSGQNIRRARALRMQGKVLRAQGDFLGALALMQDALALLQGGSYDREEIETLADLVFLRIRIGNLDGVVEFLARMARLLTSATEDPTYRLVWLELMAKVREAADKKDALYFYRLLEKSARAQRKPSHLYIALMNRALLEKHAGNEAESHRLYKKAEKVLQKNRSKIPRRLLTQALTLN